MLTLLINFILKLLMEVLSAQLLLILEIFSHFTGDDFNLLISLDTSIDVCNCFMYLIEKYALSVL